jgi:hypothetical protein
VSLSRPKGKNNVLPRRKSTIEHPTILGEFQFGLPGDGLGGSLFQTASQEERAVALFLANPNYLDDSANTT